MLVVEGSAPANIALIKYMGKEDSSQNRPTNSSLSVTLDELQTSVRISIDENHPLAQDEWKPLAIPGVAATALDEKSISRFLNHFKFLKKEWQIEKNFLLESGNNFPSDCGLASSASSFAALTKVAVEVFQKLNPRDDIGLLEISELSRRGSGSSCRSFFGPFSIWHADGARPIEFPIAGLFHQVIVVESKKKAVSSSEAHRRVPSSPLFVGRPERAERRLANLMQAFSEENWNSAFQICWDEFQDMHALFESSQPPFSYILPTTHEVLSDVKKIWEQKGDGPLATMDAGANVHLLWRLDQEKLALEVAGRWSNRFQVYSSRKDMSS